MRNTITKDELTNGDKMTGDAPIARTGLALCHRVILDSVAHWWVPARTRRVHQCHFGGRPWVAHNKVHAQHQNDKTKVTAPRLGYQHSDSSSARVKLQMYLSCLLQILHRIEFVTSFFFSVCVPCTHLDALSSHRVCGDSLEPTALTLQSDTRCFFEETWLRH